MSKASDSQAAKTRSVMEWTENHDIALVREVLLLEPFRFKARTVDRTKIWQVIARNLNAHSHLKFQVVVKSVRDHMKHLLDKHRAKMANEKRASGVEVEESELDKALEEIREKWEAAEEQDITLLNNKKKVEEDRAVGEEMRKLACEKLGETSKQKKSEDSSEPKKKTRKGGNDTIEFLKEKAKMDMEMKREEQKVKKEEQERHTRLYELTLANQQQQQQHNQLMTLMAGFMQKLAEK